MYYFYDLSSLDVKGELTTALTVLHYGNEVGAFSGLAKKTVDLDKVFALEVELTDYAKHNGDEYSYSLMFFERTWNHDVWREKLLEKRNNLSAVTTRVKLTANMVMNNTQRHRLFSSASRYIDYIEYPELATSYNVPPAYVEQFNKRFVGYLMRSKRTFSDVHSIFREYQLEDVIDGSYRLNDNQQNVRVSAYVVSKHAVTDENAIA